MSRYAALAFTEQVRAFQERAGSARANAHAVDAGPLPDPLTETEARFITEREDCFLATVGETGWPYVQYRGGPPGFVHVLDEHRLAFLDVRGNRQYITSGNLHGDARISVLLLDFAFQRRLKILGRAETRALDEDAQLAGAVAEPRTDGRAERVLVITVEGFAWNCPQHITQRFTRAEFGEALAGVEQRMRALHAENAELRRRLGER
ncbi:pyridoxamine 5'-phosphate oxidase family protein [Sciscionella marina]|uniref:pyridoxamine 5'-phosphate oxidase family protein n=1 Tax=Sciscionella marina TaxID=508770 RepID=UPI0003819E80|nr:pyridoxamine 5'-phosphate oxidase family protein [Sciscionella marina]